LLAWCATAQSLIFLSFGAVSRDRESIALGLALLVAVIVLRWRAMLGEIIAALVSINVLGWLAPAAVENLRHRDGFGAIALPSTCAFLALLALIAVGGDVAARWRQKPGGSKAPAVAAAGGAGAIAVALALAALAGRGQQQDLPPGGVRASTRDMAYSTSELHVTGGRVSIQLTNHDLFWHTLTIPELDLDLRVPVGGRRTATFDAPPGTYRFYCAIPGHRSAGMEGTLIVAAT
jgi:plastocyanin